MSDSDTRQSDLIEWINQRSPFQCQRLEVVSGDASFRRYFRFQDQGKSIIAVDAPPEKENSQVFVQVAKAYLTSGVVVPEILAADCNLGFYCQQDFGDRLFADEVKPDNCHALYTEALAYLPAIQSCTATEQGRLPNFDQQLLDSEYALFSHWLIEVHLNLSLEPQQKAIINQAFQVLTDNFKQQPQVGVHRDYHSRNLMILENGNIGVIDFQDAVIGPITYDAASLLRDCYQVWPDAMVYSVLKEWHGRYYNQYDWSQFKRWFDLTGIQRHAKASGIFARLWHRDGKLTYLQDIPRTLDYLINVANKYPQLQAFAELVKEHIKPAVERKLKCA